MTTSAAPSRGGPPGRRRRSRLLVAGAVALVVLGMGVLATYEVREEGQLLSYTEGTVYRIELLDRFEVYAEPDIKPAKSLLNGFLLMFISGMSVLALRMAPGDDRRVRALFALAGAGSAYLAVDEVLGIHESIGHNVRVLADLPGVERPDDVIVAGYALAGLVFVALFRRELARSRRALVVLAAAAFVGVAAAAADLTGSGPERLLEVVTVALAGVAFALFAEDTVVRVRVRSAPGPAPAPAPVPDGESHRPPLAATAP